MLGVARRLGPVDEFDLHAVGPLDEERAGLLALLLPGDEDPRALDLVAQSGPLPNAQGEVVQAPQGMPGRGVVQPQDVVAHEQERVLGTVGQEGEAQPLDEEVPGRGTVGHLYVDVVDTVETDPGCLGSHPRPDAAGAL